MTTTGGREAREAAERALEETRAEVFETKAETEKYAKLARDLREIRTRNHLGEAFLHIAGGKRA